MAEFRLWALALVFALLAVVVGRAALAAAPEDVAPVRRTPTPQVVEQPAQP
jgi:hypothetical protein